ncbi:ImmA/IrrE family metallo-endopeptidase [Candidatus Enterococcus ferrettii]|uniref:IrrE N-terminal-like domain-containing protein n=1 Tax=Candidatus Enterococcus ferrettii TaxID=2815324 RepID=A0ABV0EYW6_9ENTE|nr:ImmA/IrrE family metallo-endopeptidase [Enterococcus sp. 665A]MBO1342121.1 toxin [Enterococcus sp. 665A]
MNDYEDLLDDVYKEVPVLEMDLSEHEDKAFYYRNAIFIDRNLPAIKKREHLYEEYAHFLYTVGDISNQDRTDNRKQETLARNRAMSMSINLESIIDSYNQGLREYWEVAEYLGFSVAYVYKSVQEIKKIYGLIIEYKNYVLKFVNDYTISVDKK